MRIWITGGAGSGKSSLAQELAAALSANGSKYYIATMIPRDDEDRLRIRRHIEDRDGMGFETIECPCGLMVRVKPDPEGTYLLDSATAMLANAMFGERGFVYKPDAAQEAAEDLLVFSLKVKNLIVVSDGIFSDAARYDEMTDQYRRGLALIQRNMAEAFDAVIECAAGGMRILKGEVPFGERLFSGEKAPGRRLFGGEKVPGRRLFGGEKVPGRRLFGGEMQIRIASAEEAFIVGRPADSEERYRMELIIGGAFQGKREYAKAHFHLQETEIFTCSEEAEPDFDAKCIDHLELYFRRCAANGAEPAPPEAFRPDVILICEDITCGVVPVDQVDRKWRELTGRYWQRLVRSGAGVTRVICGFAERMDPAAGNAGDAGFKEEPGEQNLHENAADCRYILLLRHGKTMANEKHLYCGSTDLPLSDEGRESLRRKAAGFRKYDGIPEKIGCSGRQDTVSRHSYYTSGTKRTDETLEILFGKEALRAHSVRPGLREMDFGRFEGRSYEQLKEEPDYLKWISGDNEKNVCPGGESGEQMRQRVIAGFYRILRNDPAERMVIVTHGGPIAVIMQEMFPEKGFNRYEWQPACGEGYLLKITGMPPGRREVSYEYCGERRLP